MFQIIDVTYTGQEQFDGYPHEGTWKGYFAKSNIGQTYQVLTDENQTPIMCNTEMEHAAIQPFLNQIDAFEGSPKILVLGWGMAIINPYLNQRDCEVWYMEKYQDVVDLSPPQFNENIVIADANTTSFWTHFPIKRFDFVLQDLSVTFTNRDSVKSILTPNGKVLDWRFV